MSQRGTTVGVVLQTLVLINFKGFERFTVHLGASAMLVGPNNAGKSTIVSALRLCAAAVRLARRRKPTETFQDGDRTVRGFPLALVPKIGFVDANIRHEFRDREARLELKFSSKAVLHIVWPLEGAAFVWIHDADGPNFVAMQRARELLTEIGSVPTMTPLEAEESVLTAGYVNEMADTRLASRHFRNHLRVLKFNDLGGYASLVEFLTAWTPELTGLAVLDRFDGGKTYVDVFYQDFGSRVEKELYWAGDGLHIWLQLLFHIWRNRSESVLLLDEPDVFLHPDLQRRLVRLLEDLHKQTVLASHASEMAAEAAAGSVVWIDRTRRQSRRVADDVAFSNLTSVLGSAFNLSLARALRARVALFVEGDDMKLLGILAGRLGLRAIVAEKNLAVVPIGGFSRWPGVEAFAWLQAAFLKDAVQMTVWLDRDYRPQAEVDEIEAQLARAGVSAHIWRRKEIENYLLEPSLIARVSGVSLPDAEALLTSIAEVFRSDVLGQFIASALRYAPKGQDAATTAASASAEFEAAWTAGQGPIRLIPGKKALSVLNGELQKVGGRIVSARKLAARVDEGSIADELVVALREVEARLA